MSREVFSLLSSNETILKVSMVKTHFTKRGIQHDDPRVTLFLKNLSKMEKEGIVGEGDFY
jgi:hypothetical protein